MFHEDMRALTAKKYEILGELEMAKAAILREMSTVDKCTLTRLREIIANYEHLEKLVIDRINTFDIKTTAFITQTEKDYSVFADEIVVLNKLKEGLEALEETTNASINENEEKFDTLNEQVAQIVDRLERTPETVTPQMFGAKGDGVTDDTAAFNAIVEYFKGKKNGSVFIPKGEYVIRNEINLTNISLIGEGQQQSIIVFSSDATTAGFKIRQTALHQRSACVTVSNLSIVYDGAGEFSALHVDGEYLAERWQISPIIENVYIGTHKNGPVACGWHNGIIIENCDSAVITNCSISGRINQGGEPNYDSVSGIYIFSDEEPHGTSHTIENCQITLFQVAVNVDVTEGLQVSHCNLVGVNRGVTCRSNKPYPYVAIDSSHINASHNCIMVSTFKEVVVTGCCLYAQQCVDRAIPIHIDESVESFIVADNFICNLSAQSIYGMQICGKYGAIRGNIFHNQAGGNINPAINLHSTANNCIVTGNVTRGSAIDDWGADNVIEGNI